MGLALTLLLAAAAAHGATLEFQVRDGAGAGLKDAAVVAEPLSVDGRVERRAKAVIDQIDKTFVSHVTVVQAGTAVSFPNKDDIRHHVYSFSQAKTFELPLYTGTPSEPVVFDKPGVVVLGCNIHDFMRAYVYVVDSPYFATTGADGSARLTGLPPGRYRVHAWHPSQGVEPAPEFREVSLGKDGAHQELFTLAEGAPSGGLRLRRSPRPGGAGYR